MRKLFILADKHTQFLVIDTNVTFYHISRCLSVIINIVFNEIEHHIGVVQGWLIITLLRKAIVVIPRFHKFNQLIYSVMKWSFSRIISQHFADFVLCETHHCVEFRCEGIVGADIKSTGEVIHRDGTHSGDEATLDAGISSGFHPIEKGTQVAFLVGLFRISVNAFGIRKDGIGEVVIFVNEKIYLLPGKFTLMI